MSSAANGSRIEATVELRMIVDATEKNSGIVAAHIEAVKRQVTKENAFVFVRVTGQDSTALIKQGFATKSMDVKAKSSDWGPMAGMVPCDSAFSKKPGKPSSSPHVVHPPVNSRVRAITMQLQLPAALLEQLRGTKLERAHGYHFVGTEVHHQSTMYKLAKRLPNTSSRREHTNKNYTFYRARVSHDHPGASCLFCVRGDTNLVFWVDWNDVARTVGTLVPLTVWGYPIRGVPTPVTGDYDLWMVAPHHSRSERHEQIQSVRDEHGDSAMSNYIGELLGRMNDACDRVDKPVFQHGAEAQNYAFTQPLDREFVMFTPTGRARVVSRDVMPTVLAEISNAGYVVYWNKRYGERDPMIGGKRYEQRPENLRLQARVLTRRADDMENPTLSPLKRRFRDAVNRVMADEPAIRAFHGQLLHMLHRAERPLVKLTDQDFPGGYRPTPQAVRNELLALQECMVDATDPNGRGQTDYAQLVALLNDTPLGVIMRVNATG